MEGLFGAQMAGKEGVPRRINLLAVALHQRMTIDEISRLDFACAPPLSASLDPILVAAEQAVKKIRTQIERFLVLFKDKPLLDSRFHGNDIFIHWVAVVIPAEAGIQDI